MPLEGSGFMERRLVPLFGKRVLACPDCGLRIRARLDSSRVAVSPTVSPGPRRLAEPPRGKEPEPSAEFRELIAEIRARERELAEDDKETPPFLGTP